MLTSGPVVVMQMPEELNLDGARSFLQELEPLLECHRPRWFSMVPRFVTSTVLALK